MTGLRVTLVSLPQFPAFEGETFWVGPPAEYPDEDSNQPGLTFTGAALQCEPYYHDWGAEGLIHVFGGDIVPSSTYEAQAIHQSCAGTPEEESYYSVPLTISTGKWGDAVAPFDGSGSAQPDFTDISMIQAKFLADPSAPIKASAQQHPNRPRPQLPIDFGDVADAVASFQGTAYYYSGPCTCPSSVTCGAAACSSDSECGTGYCIGGYCTDACGLCSP